MLKEVTALLGFLTLGVAAVPVAVARFVHSTEGWSVQYPLGWETNSSDAVDGASLRICSRTCDVPIVPEGQVEIVIATPHDELDGDRVVLGSGTVPRTVVQFSSPRVSQWGAGRFETTQVTVQRNGKVFLLQMLHHLAPSQSGSEYHQLLGEIAGSIDAPAPVALHGPDLFLLPPEKLRP